MKRMWVTVLAVMLGVGGARGERIKDIVSIPGERGNVIDGPGLVVGLNGTGDGGTASSRAMANMYRNSQMVFTPEQLSSKNIASVWVTAHLPSVARKGNKIDVTVASIGDTTSLLGGILLPAHLLGPDKQVYAIAQGAVSVGGFAASGQTASVSKNHPTVGTITNGAIVEKEELGYRVINGKVTLSLHNPDITTAENIAKAINTVFPRSCHAPDPGTVIVEVPRTLTKASLGGFIDKILMLEVEVDSRAVVVVNERTGAIIVGENVRISAVAITYGELTIITKEKDYVSQPLPFSQTGTTEKTHRTDLEVIQEQRPLHVIPHQVSVAELARALNAMGLTSRDLITIFEMLRAQGALQAELKTM